MPRQIRHPRSHGEEAWNIRHRDAPGWPDMAELPRPEHLRPEHPRQLDALGPGVAVAVLVLGALLFWGGLILWGLL